MSARWTKTDLLSPSVPLISVPVCPAIARSTVPRGTDCASTLSLPDLHWTFGRGSPAHVTPYRPDVSAAGTWPLKGAPGLQPSPAARSPAANVGHRKRKVTRH